ncbi:MAG TPA: FkbM family methyltransferase, partial [Bryobacteraceae bacterium]|nr:FkbM family methyltransferase [Bryobacteraceae bacterium]
QLGARWQSFSEYWSYCGSGSHGGPTNLIGAEVQLLLRTCARSAANPVAIDGGANVGAFTVELAALGYEVHAFEPIPETYGRLLENLAINPDLQSRVRSHNSALGDQDGAIVHMTLPGNSPSTPHVTQPGEHGGTLQVPATTIDSYASAKHIDRIAFLKLDVEGFEPAVLRGASRMLNERRVDIVFFEWCPSLLRASGFDPAEMLQFLGRSEYELCRVGEGGTLREITASAAMSPECLWDNLVARPKPV